MKLRPRRRRGVRYIRGNEIVSVTRPDERWSVDFVHDALRVLKALTIVDDFNRECIGIEVDFSLTGKRVARVLTQPAERRGGLPATVKGDNGGEFTSDKMLEWSVLHGVDLHFIDPGKPNRNASVEASSGRFSQHVANVLDSVA